jgi:hypothetical protein
LVSRRTNKAGSRTSKVNRKNETTAAATPKGDQDIKDFIETTVCRRRVLNSVFGNIQTVNDNCCDLCSPSQPPVALQHRTTPTPRITAPTPAHIAMAKRLILTWRSIVFREYYMNRDAQMMETVLMDDNTVVKLAKKCNQVTGRESLRSLIKWRLDNKHDSLLAKLLIRLNENQRTPPS